MNVLNNVLGRSTPAQVAAATGPTPAPATGGGAVSVRDLYGAATTAAGGPSALAEAQGPGAALAAGLLAFAAVGALVTMRVVFKGAIS